MTSRPTSPYKYPTHTIKPRRIARGLTQMQLAIALDVDIDTVRRWEQGRNQQPTADNMFRLDDLLGPPDQEGTDR